MRVVYLTTPGTMVRRKADRLQVFQGETRLEDIRLFQLDRLVVLGAVQLTSQAMALLLDRGTDVVFLSATGRLRGVLSSGVSRNVYLRLAQFDRWRDEPFRLELARAVVTAKITSQRRVVAHFLRSHRDREVDGVVQRLEDALGQLPAAESVDIVRGIEGNAAAAYFKQYARMLTRVGFPGRKKHPATDPANSLLSLGYVMLTNELGSLLEAQGFDPAIGFLHGIRYGRQSLALDMVEPFRQPVIDRLTTRLLNLGRISPDEMEGGSDGLRLAPDAFKRYLGLYEEHLRAPSSAEGSPSWRAVIRDQVGALKEMVMTREVAPLYAWTGGEAAPASGAEPQDTGADAG